MDSHDLPPNDTKGFRMKLFVHGNLTDLSKLVLRLVWVRDRYKRMEFQGLPPETTPPSKLLMERLPIQIIIITNAALLGAVTFGLKRLTHLQKMRRSTGYTRIRLVRMTK